MISENWNGVVIVKSTVDKNTYATRIRSGSNENEPAKTNLCANPRLQPTQIAFSPTKTRFDYSPCMLCS